MDKMEHRDLPIQEAMKLAKDPTAQELIRLLQRNGGDSLRQAMEKAAAGDYTQAKKALQHLMESPEAKDLLRQLGGKP